MFTVFYLNHVGGHRRVASDGSEKLYRDSQRYSSHQTGGGTSQQRNPGPSRERYFESKGNFLHIVFTFHSNRLRFIPYPKIQAGQMAFICTIHI